MRVRAHRASFNYDNQEGDGLATGISTFAGELWREAGVRPRDIDVASIYDDYPTMVLAQLNDLGMIPGNDLARFCRREIGERRFPLNTWGGMLSAGQPGGPAGGLNGISEAVLQLQHRAGERQVKDARLAVATGYGMTMYRYGGTAAAAVLERATNDAGSRHLALRELPRAVFPAAAAVRALPRRRIRARIGSTRRWWRRSPSSATCSDRPTGSRAASPACAPPMACASPSGSPTTAGPAR